MNLIAWGLILTLSLFWALSFIFVELALTSFHPAMIVCLRIGLPAICFMIWRIGKFKQILSRWRQYLIIGTFANVIPFSCYSFGQQYIDGSLAATINSTTPLFATLIAFLSGQERMNWTRTLGIFIAVSGVALVTQASGVQSSDGILGAVLSLTACACYGIAVVYSKHAISKINPIDNATGQLFFASLLSLIALFFVPTDQLVVDINSQAIIGILGVAFLGTFIAYMIYFKLLSQTGAVNVVLPTIFIPPMSAVLAIVILDEVINLRFVFGMVLIIVAIFFIEKRLLRIFGIKPKPQL